MVRTTYLYLSLPLAVLIAFVSWKGLYTPGFYAVETANWQAQSVGQDIVDLFVVTPVLVITAVLAYRRSQIGLLMWGGTLLYLIYTFMIYTFDIHFNQLFLLYCLSLSFSFYSFLYFIVSLITQKSIRYMHKLRASMIIGWYFIFISLAFYLLWLSDVIPPSLAGTTPQALIETGLWTNPVHVIDLSLFLPGVFMIGVLLLQKKPVGQLLAPVILTFFILMDSTLIVLSIVMNQKGVEHGYTIAYMMSVFACLSLLLFVWYMKSSIKILS